MRRGPGEKSQATHMPKLAITISDDGSLVRKRIFSGLITCHTLDPKISWNIGKGNDKGMGNILEIPVDDAMVMQVLHAGQDGTRDKTKPISLSLPSPGEEQSNAPKHCHGISFREMTVLAKALEELSADSELESEVVLRPRLEPFVELDLQKDNQTC